MKTANFLLAAMLMMVSIASHAAETAGVVGYMSGTLVAQRQDGTIKVLAGKSEVFAGDMLITAKDSYANVKLKDGSQMTLRPNSNLRIENFQFTKEEPQKDNMLLSLLKGGFRTVTGMIGKRGNADAYKVRAASATIGIRGTDFTSRLCITKGCKDDEDESVTQAVANAPVTVPVVIGRVMKVQGELSAKGGDDKVRKLALGARIYEGDVLTTGAGSYAIVAFRDEGRVSLQANTVFQVEKFKYDKVAAQENAVLRLFKGGVRVVTGLIGRAKHDNYQFRVSSATIGIRGTGFDAWCNGPCANGSDNPGATQDNPLDGAGVYVWGGEVVLVTPGGSFVVAIQQAAIIARDTGKPIRVIAVPSSIIDNATPRPDTVPVNIEELFGSDANAGDAGLYVTVHDGEVVLSKGDKSLDLGAGETGFAQDDILARLAKAPEFMDGDPKMDPFGEGLKDSGAGMTDAGCKL